MNVRIQQAAMTSIAKDQGEDSALWLGIDLGTTSVKCVVVDKDDVVIASRSKPSDSNAPSHVGSNGSEQDPAKIIEVTECLIKEMMAAYRERISGISVTGQMHGILLWKKNDGAGEKNFDTLTAMHSEEFQTSNLYTWQDQRCSTSFLDSLPAPSNDLQPLSSGHGCATLFWLAKHRRSWLQQKGFTSCGTIMDYLVSLLCGLQHSTTSDQLAASLGYFNTSLSQWDTGLSEAKYFPAHLLPVIKPAGTIAGYVRSSLSFWPDEVGVYVGLGDVQCAMRAVLSSNKDAGNEVKYSSCPTISLVSIVQKTFRKYCEKG